MDYGKILKRSFEITKKYKILWIFGMLIISGGGGGIGNSGSGFSEAGNSFNASSSADQWIMDVQNFFINYWWVVLIFVIALFLFMLIGFIVSLAAKGAMFKGVDTATKGEKVKFWHHFGFGFHKFWRILGIDLLIFLIMLGILFALGLISIPFLIFFLVPVIGWIVFIMFILLAIIALFLAAALITMFINYIYCYALIEDKKIKESFRLGWDLMKENFSKTLVMALILFGVTFAFTLVALLAIFLIFVPLFIVGMVLYHSMGLWGGIITGIFALIILILFALLIKGIRNTYIISAWVLTWQELSGSITKVRNERKPRSTKAAKSAKTANKKPAKKKSSAKTKKKSVPRKSKEEE
ncbi:hypothetical protein KKC88_02945 [Patescibacteria group bacterium]|nr:hypothetical protein [Patescibacteria group bacterium]MBU1673827.1 hypothetical protein [Patescibacteria group bacterium]MBU1964074.1 hypothetical protein [Patescibacteria group bacterium]